MIGRWVLTVVALLAVAPAAAAAPRVGAWESGGRFEPRVAFDVRGAPGRRTVRRVSVPLTCRGERSTVGWATTDFAAPVRGGRFTAYGDAFVLRGRFLSGSRASVAVHTRDGPCHDVRRYVAGSRGRRIGVRTGRYLSLVGGGAEVYLMVTAFGRMIEVEFLRGSADFTCSDGTLQSLPLGGPEDLVLAAPVGPRGGFHIAGGFDSTIDIYGSVQGGSVAAFADVTRLLPDGTDCHARGLTLVGSLAFPEATGGRGEFYPAPVGWTEVSA
jgi:hypothetical protein